MSLQSEATLEIPKSNSFGFQRLKFLLFPSDGGRTRSLSRVLIALFPAAISLIWSKFKSDNDERCLLTTIVEQKDKADGRK